MYSPYYSIEAITKRTEFEHNLHRCLDIVPADEAPIATLTSYQKIICDLLVEIISKIETLILNTEPAASSASTHFM